MRIGQCDKKEKKFLENKEKWYNFCYKNFIDSKSTWVWGYFENIGKIKDIVLSRRRDKFNNRIGFVKLGEGVSTLQMTDKFNDTRFKGVKLDLQGR